MESASQLLTVSHEVRDGGVVVTARGELDLLTTPLLAEELTLACRSVTPPQRVVVDLRYVSFLGAEGISCLLDGRGACVRAQTPLRIVANGTVVLRPLRVLELESTFQVTDRVEHALAPLPARREDSPQAE